MCKEEFNIHIQILCLNQLCKYFRRFHDIYEMEFFHTAGEILCPECGQNEFSIILIRDDKNEL